VITEATKLEDKSYGTKITMEYDWWNLYRANSLWFRFICL